MEQIEFTKDWFTQNIPVWNHVLEPLKTREILALELGTFEGRSAKWLLDNILVHPESYLITVDSFNGGEEHSDIDFKQVERTARKTLEPYENVHLMKKDTQSALLGLGYEDHEFDLVYIDASHQAPDVLRDAVLSHELLNSGGYLIFDDYLWGGVSYSTHKPKIAIDSFINCYADQYDVMSLGYQVILRKK